MLSELR